MVLLCPHNGMYSFQSCSRGNSSLCVPTSDKPIGHFYSKPEQSPRTERVSCLFVFFCLDL